MKAAIIISRLFDAAQAGAVLWGDKLLLKRYLAQYSRTGPAEQTGELTFQAIKMRKIVGKTVDSAIKLRINNQSSF